MTCRLEQAPTIIYLDCCIVERAADVLLLLVYWLVIQK